MNKNNTIIVLLFILIISHFIQCNAPRNNPLDPNNPNNPHVILEGRVQTYSVPRIAIDEVNVFWENENIVSKTGVDGSFSIENIMAVNGWLFFERNGFHKDSIYIEWENKKKIFTEKFLNATPTPDSLLVFSLVENWDAGIIIHSFTLKAKISDPDNDMDSVLWEIPDLGLDGFLKYNTETGFFERSYRTSLFEIDFEEFVGHDFLFIVKDKFEKYITVGKRQIIRVITEEVVLTSPISGETVSSTPTLDWNQINAGFSYSYMVQVFKAGGPSELAWEKTGISETTTQYIVDSELENGNYSWVVWAIDKFNNRSRSKYRSFSVNSEEK